MKAMAYSTVVVQLNRAQQEKSLCFVQATLFTADITDKWLFLL